LLNLEISEPRHERIRLTEFKALAAARRTITAPSWHEDCILGFPGRSQLSTVQLLTASISDFLNAFFHRTNESCHHR
jgi:hypothetical protein